MTELEVLQDILIKLERLITLLEYSTKCINTIELYVLVIVYIIGLVIAFYIARWIYKSYIIGIFKKSIY